MAAQLLAGVLHVSDFVDADVLARGVSASDRQTAAIAAGRAMLRRLDELIEERRSFGLETTLASRSFAPRIRRLVAAGYATSTVNDQTLWRRILAEAR